MLEGKGNGEVRFEEEENLAREAVLRPSTAEPAAPVDSWSEAGSDDDASEPSAEVGVDRRIK
ncbi:hypothetical protein FRC12_001996 [Ceratobasidium sp. 428]|nr:hypothetical protein FRC12_001996 [Ceratobasidium sp. 428]